MSFFLSADNFATNSLEFFRKTERRLTILNKKLRPVVKLSAGATSHIQSYSHLTNMVSKILPTRYSVRLVQLFEEQMETIHHSTVTKCQSREWNFIYNATNVVEKSRSQWSTITH